MPIMLGTSRIDAEAAFGTLECEQLASQDCVFFHASMVNGIANPLTI